MVRFLSQAWLDRLDQVTGERSGAGTAAGGDVLVIRQVVTGVGDGGPVGYDVILSDGSASVRPSSGAADVTCTSDYVTASSVASGRLTVPVALAAGRIKLAGDVARLARAVADLGPVDPLPPDLRADTEFPAAGDGERHDPRRAVASGEQP